MKLKTAYAALLLVTPTLAYGTPQDAVYDYFMSQYRSAHSEEVSSNMADCIASWMTDAEAEAFLIVPVGSSLGLGDIANLTSALACVSAATAQ